MNQIIYFIERLLFAARWLMVPVYLGMIALLAMLVVYFFLEVVHALPQLAGMSENDLIVLTLSLIDLSLAANLVILVILSGYENFVSRVRIAPSEHRPVWLTMIDFSGLKLKVLGSITVIAAVHLLGDFFEPGKKDDRTLGWQVLIVVVFALLGLVFAFTDRIGESDHRSEN